MPPFRKRELAPHPPRTTASSSWRTARRPPLHADPALQIADTATLGAPAISGNRIFVKDLSSSRSGRWIDRQDETAERAEIAEQVYFCELCEFAVNVRFSYSPATNQNHRVTTSSTRKTATLKRLGHRFPILPNRPGLERDPRSARRSVSWTSECSPRSGDTSRVAISTSPIDTRKPARPAHRPRDDLIRVSSAPTT